MSTTSQGQNPQHTGKDEIQYHPLTFSIVHAIKQSSSQQTAKKYIKQSLEHAELRTRIVNDLIHYVKDPDVTNDMKIYIFEKLAGMRSTNQELSEMEKRRGHKSANKALEFTKNRDGTYKAPVRRQSISIKTGTIGDYIQQQSIKSLIPELESIDISVQVALLNLLSMMGRKLVKLPETSKTMLVKILHTMLEIDEDIINKNEETRTIINGHKQRLESILEILSMLEITDETMIQSMHRLKNTCRDRKIRAHIRIPEDTSMPRSGFIRGGINFRKKWKQSEILKEAKDVLDRASGRFSTRRNNRWYVEHIYDTVMKGQSSYNRMEFARHLDDEILKTANPKIKHRKKEQLLRFYDIIHSMK